MNMRATGERAMDEEDEMEYTHRLEVGETSGEQKRQDLVYFLVVRLEIPKFPIFLFKRTTCT
jgi:hypothetical protein